MKSKLFLSILMGICWVALAVTTNAQVPGLINYQGRIVDGGTNFDGTGQFEFALVSSDGSTNYWSNDGTAAGQPGIPVTLPVTKGLYSVLLGDTTITHMTTAVPVSVFANSTVLLRVWFNDGMTGFQQLSPDQRIASVGYALQAQNAYTAVVAGGTLPSSIVYGQSLNVGTNNTLASGLFASVAGGSNNTASASEAFVGGGAQNTANSQYATVAGGLGNTASGFESTVGGGEQNSATFNDATVGGGFENMAIGPDATVGGGLGNTASDYKATTIGGGQNNTASSGWSAIGGGYQNTIQSNSQYSTIGGGNNNTASNQYATVGGGAQNTASGIGSFVGGGGTDGNISPGNTASGAASMVAGGLQNSANNSYTTVAGGANNQADNPYATIGGGFGNTASGTGSFVGGGGSDGVNFQGNTASGAASTVGGGFQNSANNSYTTVAGGSGNTAVFFADTVGGGLGNTANGGDATVAGGLQNLATNASATVGGGHQNSAGGQYATVGGGGNNSANNTYATVPGGSGNTAGGYASFAAGQNATASHNNSFVWGDGTRAAASQGVDTFAVLATGAGGVGFFVGNSVRVSIGYTATHDIDVTSGAFLSHPGVWTSVSDRNVKGNFADINAREVLERVLAMPVQSWSYNVEDPSIRHIGPMAQDFYSAFKVGSDDKHIGAIDEGGVAFAAIQGLNQKVEQQRSELQAKQSQIAELRRELDDIKSELHLAGKQNSQEKGR